MKPCLLIPIYDHGDTIRGVVESLQRFELPCIVVDDGSGAETRAVLDDLERELSSVEVLHHPRNAGKGAALKTGYRAAAERGFSHVLQMDADGQHDADDVPRFLEAMAKEPDALVLTLPIFDDSAPWLRLASRQLSVGIVWLATLSFAVRDPLVGFRGLPLEAVLRVIDTTPTGDYMEFDPEIIVRMYWDGVPIAQVPSRVTYDPDGLSHFDVLWDDLRLAGVYTRLVGGMLLRAPGLLRRHGDSR